MARSAPRLAPGTVFSRTRSDGVRTYFEDRGAKRYSFYGYGKVAMRDGLDALLEKRDASNVVLPAYLPFGIVEPFREVGLEPRYYDCDRRLQPDLDRIEDLLDSETLAVMFVHYFGQPQAREGIEAIRELAAEYDAFTIDDNAHSALSTLDDRLLGTFGDIGITSLRKTLPIPNGAALFLNDEDLSEAALSRSAVREHYTKADYRYCARSFGGSVSGRTGIKETLSVLRWANGHRYESNGHVREDAIEADPREVYEATKVPMSRLSMHVLDRIDPIDVIATRRANYRRWDRRLQEFDGVEPAFASLSLSACPQYYPAIVREPADLGALAEVAQPWPPLPYDVRDDPAFETTNFLSSHLYTLPVHGDIEPARFEGHGA
ncbi:MAG: DegT/DnrJ/EryC1/StrS family aminotransferase [Halalkalicoccus sp.]